MKKTSDMGHMHSPQGVDHYPCYTPSQIGTITEGSGSMEESVLCLSNTVACSMACNKLAADISVLLLPPVTVPIFCLSEAWIMISTRLYINIGHFRVVHSCPA